MREKQIRHYTIFSIIELFPLLIFFIASEIFRRNLLWEKYRNYPLTTTQGDRLVSCENVVSRTQTSSLPPREARNTCEHNKPSDSNVYHANDSYMVKSMPKRKLC